MQDEIIVVFIVVCLVFLFLSARNCFYKLYRKKTDIKKVLDDIRDYKDGEYTLKYEEINRVISDNKTVGHIWIEFSKTLTKHRDVNNDIDVLTSPICASDIIKYSAVVSDIDIRFWQNFGSVFTGLGILGTFIGLTLGLNNVDLSSSDVSVLKEGIGSLLKGISTAFYTSLLGIFTAISYGLVYAIFKNNLSDRVMELSNRIEGMYPRKTAEQWLSDEHRESIEQTKAIKNLSQDIATSLDALLEERLSDGFNELCEKLDDTLRPTFEKLYEAISALNDGGANVIAGAVSEKTGAQLDAFANVLQDIQETMKTNMVSAERMNAQANQMMTETMKQITASLSQGTDESVKKQKEATEQMSQQMKEIVESFNQSSEKAMNNMLLASSTTQKGLNESIEKTKESTKNMLDSVNDIITKQAKILEDSIESNNKRVNDTVGMLEQTINKNNESVSQSYLLIKDMTQTISSMLDKLKTSGESMQESVAPIIEATQQLKRQLELVQEQTKILHENTVRQMDKLGACNISTEQSMQKLSETVVVAEKKAIDAWDKYHNGLVNMETELGDALDKITEHITQYNQLMSDGLQTQLGEFDNNVKEVVNSLKTVMEELTDVVEELIKHKNDRTYER